MPTRLIVAYSLIASLVVIFAAIYWHLTKERRSYGRAVRRYDRAQKQSRKKQAKLAAEVTSTPKDPRRCPAAQ